MSKNVLIKDWESLVEDEVVEIEIGNGIIATVHKTIDLVDMLSFVKEVVEGSFDTSTGEYTPEVVDMLIRANTLTRYANFKLPEDVEKQYKLLYFTNVYDAVLSVINYDQHYQISNAIHSALKYNKEIAVASATMESRKLLEQLNAIVNELGDALSGINGDELVQIVDRFANVSADDIADAIIRKQD